MLLIVTDIYLPVYTNLSRIYMYENLEYGHCITEFEEQIHLTILFRVLSADLSFSNIMKSDAIAKILQLVIVMVTVCIYH